MATPVLTDLWAVYSEDGTVYLRIDSDGDIIGAAGGIDLGTTALEIGAVFVGADKAISLGDGQEATLTWVSASADLVFDNTSATGSTILRLGTDTSATDWQVQNNSASPILAITGAGALTSALSTIDFQGTGAVTIDSSAGAISIGSDAVAQAVNVATGNAARVITIGHSASASLSMEAGVGAWTLQGDTTGALTAGTGLTFTATAGGIVLDSQSATAAVYVTLGTDTTATEFAVRNNSESRALIVDGAGNVTLGGATTATTTHTARDKRSVSGTGTGLVVEQEGTTATEGWQRVIYEATVAPAAIETALLTIPAGSIVDAVVANVETILTGGGTSVTWSLGITGDVDAYGTATSDDYTTAADSLAANAKWSALAGVTPPANAGASIGLFSAAAVDLKLIAAATGGTAAGNTALTGGTVRVRVCYRTVLPMADV